MDPQRKERIIDNVLDRALRPQLVEPRAGLEERILANLHAQPESRPWWQWMWIPALAAAAVLAVVIGIRVMHREKPAPVQVKNTIEAPKPEVARKPKPPVQPVTPRREVAKRATPRERTVTVAKSKSLPRMDVFPAPLPMTEQERLLLALVNHQRPQAEQIALEQQAQRESFHKYLETGEAPVAPPVPAQPMR